MVELMGEPQGMLKQRWVQSRRSLPMLLMLPRESWPRLFTGLRHYTEWLVQNERNSEALSDFEKRLADAEAYRKEKVESGEMSEAEAETHKGDGIWLLAIERTQEAALFMAIRIVLERDLLAHLKKELPANSKTLSEIQEEVEHELVENLRRFVNIDAV